MGAGSISAALAGGYSAPPAPPAGALVLEAAVTSTTGWGTTHNVTVPANNEGDALLIFFNTQNAVATTLPANWTQQFVVGVARKLSCYSRIAPSGGVSTPVAITSAADCFGCWLTYRVSGSTGEIEYATATGNSTNANPPNLTPTWGSAETLWIAACSTQDTPSTYPVDYGDTRTITNSGGIVCSAASRLLTAASADPGTFTTSNQEWAAATVAIRPA